LKELENGRIPKTRVLFSGLYGRYSDKTYTTQDSYVIRKTHVTPYVEASKEELPNLSTIIIKLANPENNTYSAQPVVHREVYITSDTSRQMNEYGRIHSLNSGYNLGHIRSSKSSNYWVFDKYGQDGSKIFQKTNMNENSARSAIKLAKKLSTVLVSSHPDFESRGSTTSKVLELRELCEKELIDEGHIDRIWKDILEQIYTSEVLDR
jgi:hypothetical protein